MRPSAFFRFCPQCGAEADSAAGNPLVCPACDFTYYFNPVPAVAALLLDPLNRLLLIERAHEPARGKLALPGGFVEVGETAENALSREIREEVGLKVHGFEYLCSFPNEYHYRGVTYSILDLFLTARVASTGEALVLDEVAALEWIPLKEIDLSRIAFGSIRGAIQVLQSRIPRVG